MSPAQAGRFHNHLRRLRKLGVIDPATFCVADILLWLFRKPLQSSAMARLKAIARESGVKLTKVKQAVAQLDALGLVRRERKRVRVFWGHNKQLVASRQAPNVYRFVLPSTEVASRPPDTRVQTLILAARPLEAALAALGAGLAAAVPRQDSS